MKDTGKQARGIATKLALLEAAGRVFSRMTYDKAKLKDISDEAGISLGSLYFHFGNKDDIAEAVLQTQRDRLSGIALEAEEGKGTGRERLFQLFEGYAKVISVDTIVQAGILLVSSLPDELKSWGQGFHNEWEQLCLSLIKEGVADGSITSSWSVEDLGELLNELFAGAQTLSGVEDGWASFPKRITRAKPLYDLLLTS
ncbi:TetR/AcrR family transcriptional regulator [Leucobacter viscericola]|uniref:TetR/AcrR family transcriptional regulator n=1 Tax=Leucobacter viscericola TaxID=2714935 RepID=A0A6G7XCL0_9MICO|nr:TetR/AcrR family transcriptional regulator [Leucobacter viscericola]QIK62206.1 TetR/AcrR family transcriptional regulator [Leucobacter viscericola]